MKRKLVILVLAVLLLSMVGATIAKPTEKTKVVWGMDESGNMLGGGFGVVTFDTNSGAWSVTTRGRTLDTDVGIYYFGITTSKPVKGIAPDMTPIETLYDADGYIDVSGTVSDTALLSEINQNIANGGVFYLGANSV